ncbi:hypothetical protein [Pseudorhodoplanes sp.]|uniref:hypothetical protein n=1 Tax=Pseudorhodoplanes sp. TaxID=1934341 RepID=UPI002B9B7C9C|nr:hypothetical protein [Pseudorhodoplanes sp.]HWV53396.1 hypothetical protein [Pseudorhodoplanes sp.]
MSRTTLGAAILTLAATLPAGLSPASAAELPLKQVILSNSGLAQFTHAGSVTGNSTVELAVRLDQVDDVLKSLTIFDRAGAVGTVSLPGKTPLPELFRDLPFGPEALNSSPDLLNALTGSEIEISGPVTAKGRVFRVVREQVALPNNGGTTSRHRLTLMTPAGLTQAILEEVTELRFVDPQTRQQVERLLAGLIENRAKERRTVSVGFLGDGTRDAAISYVVGAPVWKTAYRLVLPKDGDKARLQGWAVIENLTGGDWKDVDLTLVSGNPVALRQPLYTALFANRPEVPVSTTTPVVPRRDDVQEKAAPPSPQAQFRSDQVAGALAREKLARQMAVAPASVAAPAPITAAPAAAAANAAAAQEASTQLLYRFPAKLSLATGHTMMVPFVDRDISIARIWLYQPDISPSRPMAAVRVKNDGDTALPAGLVTAFDRSADGSTSFVGDALLPLTPKDATRLATFALDTKTAIRRHDKGMVQTSLGKALNGTLTVQTRSTRTIDYEVTTPPDEDREIVVEEERVSGWTPVAGARNIEETPTRYRHTISAQKGKITKASFTTEHLDSERIALADLDVDDILVRISGLQNESPVLKAVVAKLTTLVEEMNRAKVQRGQLENERERIVRDQDRVRSNLQSVGQNSDLGRRYLATLKSQEDRLVEIGNADAKLEKEIDAKTKAAQDAVRQLTL